MRSSACGAERDVHHRFGPRGKPRGRRVVLPHISTPPLTAPAPAIGSAVHRLEVRPLRPADRERLADLFDRLSERSRHHRFLGPKSRLSEAELDRLTQLDHITRDAVAAVDRASGDIVGVARYAAGRDANSAADIAVVVADDWQGRGLGTALARLVVWRAATTGFTRLVAHVLDDNPRSHALLHKLGFELHARERNVLEFRLDI